MFDVDALTAVAFVSSRSSSDDDKEMLEEMSQDSVMGTLRHGTTNRASP